MYFVSIWQHCEGAVYSYRYLLLTFARGNVHAALITAPVVQAHKSTCGTSTPFLCEGSRIICPNDFAWHLMVGHSGLNRTSLWILVNTFLLT